MAQPIRSGFRDANPGDFGTGEAIRQLNHLRDRGDFKKDREHRNILEDKRILDKYTMDASINGAKVNSQKVKDLRDNMTKYLKTGKSTDEAYVSLKNEALSEIQRANVALSDSNKGMAGAAADVKKNSLYYKPGAYSEIAEKGAAGTFNPAEFRDEYFNYEQQLDDLIADNLKMTTAVTNERIGNANQGQQISYTQDWFNPNGEEVAFKEKQNLAWVQRMSHGIGLSEEMNGKIDQWVRDREEEISEMSEAEMSEQDRNFAGLRSTFDKRAAIIVDHGSDQATYGKDIKTQSIVDSRLSPTTVKNEDAARRLQEDVDYFTSRDAEMMTSRFNTADTDLEVGEFNDDGTYDIVVIEKGYNKYGEREEDMDKKTSYTVDPKRPDVTKALIQNIREQTKKKEVVGGVSPYVGKQYYDKNTGTTYNFEDMNFTDEQLQVLINNGSVEEVKQEK